MSCARQFGGRGCCLSIRCARSPAPSASGTWPRAVAADLSGPTAKTVHGTRRGPWPSAETVHGTRGSLWPSAKTVHGTRERPWPSAKTVRGTRERPWRSAKTVHGVSLSDFPPFGAFLAHAFRIRRRSEPSRRSIPGFAAARSVPGAQFPDSPLIGVFPALNSRISLRLVPSWPRFPDWPPFGAFRATHTGPTAVLDDEVAAAPRLRPKLYQTDVFIYTGCMSRRTTLEIDDALLHQAQKALGTKGLKETVDKAFREAVRRHLRQRLAERILTGVGIDRSPEMLAESRPSR